MRKILLLIINSLLVQIANSQQTDTTARNHLKADINQKHWAVNFNTGIQKRFFFGAGLSKNHFIGSPHGIYGYDIYTSFAFFPSFKSQQNSIIAVNVGGLLCGSGGAFGAELKYVKSKIADDVMFIPKIGLGIGSIHLTYGYALSFNKYPVDEIGKNVFALHVNLPFYTKDLLKDAPENKQGKK
jgi:hypothetical protein